MKEKLSEPFNILHCPQCQHLTFYVYLTENKTEVKCTNCGWIAIAQQDWTKIPTLRELEIHIDKQIRLNDRGINNRTQTWKSKEYGCPYCNSRAFFAAIEQKDGCIVKRLVLICAVCGRRILPEDVTHNDD